MKFSKKIKFPKILIVFLLILVFLVGCNTKSSGTQIPISSFLDQDKNEVVTKIKSLSEMERLDTEYRQTNYADGYDEVTKRLNDEFNNLLEENLPKLIPQKYLYRGEIVLTNEGYNESQLNNYSLKDITSEHEDWIVDFDLKLIMFVEGYSEVILDEETNIIRYNRSFFSVGPLDELRVLTSDILVPYIKFFDLELLENYDKPTNTYSDDYYSELAYFYYLNPKLGNGIKERTKDTLLYLSEKFGEKFMRVDSTYSAAVDSHIWPYAPLWDLSIKFEANGGLIGYDAYTKVAYQQILGGHIEEVIKKYNAEDKIGYFIAAESNYNSNIKEVTSLKKGLEGLKELDKTCDISLYYAKDNMEEEDKELISKIINDIYKKVNNDAHIFIYTYIYSLEEEDRAIFLKILDKDKFSENYLKRINSSDTWSDTMMRTRNNSDSFKFLDVFGEKEPYMYLTTFALKNTLGDALENMKQKNKYEK